MEIPTVIASFCWSLPICKKSNLLFWITLNTSDHFHLKWLKVFLLLLPYHMQNTNFITPTHSWHKTDSLFVVTLGMFRHAWAHLFEALIKNLILGAFKPSKPSPSKFICKNWDPSLFLFYDLKIHGKKIKNWWSRGLAFQENGKRNETKLIGHSC